MRCSGCTRCFSVRPKKSESKPKSRTLPKMYLRTFGIFKAIGVFPILYDAAILIFFYFTTEDLLKLFCMFLENETKIFALKNIKKAGLVCIVKESDSSFIGLCSFITSYRYIYTKHSEAKMGIINSNAFWDDNISKFLIKVLFVENLFNFFSLNFEIWC